MAKRKLMTGGIFGDLPISWKPPRKPQRKQRHVPVVTGGLMGLDPSDDAGAVLPDLPPRLALKPCTWRIEIKAAPVKRGRPAKLSPQQRLDVGSYIINRQWDIAIADAKRRDDSSAGARFHREHRAVKDGAPPV